MSGVIRRNSQVPPNQVPPCQNEQQQEKNNIPNVATSPAMLDNNNPPTNGYLAKDEEEEDTLSASSATDLPTPPDGGWGWAVVFASFMIHVIADGITYTLGIYVVELKEAFGEGSGSVSFIPSILVGITLGSGPIASMLTNRYGCRIVTIIGAIFASIGLAVSAAASSLVVLYFTIGVCTGLGFGLIYLPAIVSVSMYFEKRRAFATGIAVCGSGLGTFIMAPVTQGLIAEFGWKGSLLITAAIVLLNVLFGAMFRPIPTSDDTLVGSNSTGAETLNNLAEMDGVALTKTSNNSSFASGDHGLPPEIKLNGESLRPFALQMGAVDGKYSDVARMALSHPVLSSQPPYKKPSVQYGSHSRIYEKKTPQNNHHGHGRHHTHRNSGVMFRKDILYSGSLYNIPEYKSNPRRYSRYHITVPESDRARLASKSEAASKVASSDLKEGGKGQSKSIDGDNDRLCGCVPVSMDAAKAFRQMVDFSLLKNSIFIMFAISNFLTSIGFNVPYVYTVDRAVNLGIDQDDASFLLSVVGIANTLGRIVLGYVSDRPWLNRLYLYNTSLAVCGISMGLSNFCKDYTSQAIFCAVFGITSGAYVGLTSVVLVDLLGLDNLTNAFGLLLLFQGIASVLGPPFIGWLYDEMGNYETGFYFSGSMIFLSGVMLFVLPWMQRRQASNSALESRKRLEVDDEFGRIKAIEDIEEEEYDSEENKPMTMEARPAAELLEQA